MAGIDPDAFVHPQAVVMESDIGAGTKVWQFATVIRGAKVGRKCVICPGVCFDGSVMGNGVHLSPNVDIGPGFIIEDDVFIGPNVVLCNDAWPRTRKDHFDPAGGTSVIVREGASIGCNAVVVPGVEIGKGAMIAAGAVVTKSVPDECIWPRDGEVYRIYSEESRLRRRMRFV